MNNIKLGNIKSFCIHLKDRKDRLQYIENELKKITSNFEIVYGLYQSDHYIDKIEKICHIALNEPDFNYFIKLLKDIRNVKNKCNITYKRLKLESNVYIDKIRNNINNSDYRLILNFITKSEEFSKGKGGVSMSFKSVLKKTKSLKLPYVMIFEDDVKFFKESRDKLQECISSLPDDWDILLGGSYGFRGNNFNENLIKVDSFTSLHCILVKETVYEYILNHDGESHLDVYLSKFCKDLNVYLCNPMVAIQRETLSDNANGLLDNSVLKKFNILR